MSETSNNNLPDADKLTGIDYLGCGYDIFGYYGRVDSIISKQLVTMPKADAVIEVYGDKYFYPKDAIRAVLVKQTEYGTAFSENIEDLYTEMSAAVELSGSKGLFSAEVSAKYSSSYSSSSYFYHATYAGYINAYKLTLDLDYAHNHLDKGFKHDLYTMDAKALVSKYGTHFLYEGIFGGRWSYSQSLSKFSYSSSEDAAVKVKANYGTYAGQISAEIATDESGSNSESNAMFSCIGGTPNTLVDGFDAWAASVSNNFTLVDFNDSSLKPISEFVRHDNQRKEEIDAAIKAVILETGEPTPTTQLTTSASPDVWSAGSSNIDKEIEADSGAKQGYAVVGFGGRIKNKNFTRIAVCYLNLTTAQRHWDVFGDRTVFNRDDYETLGEVPDGCVVTGIGLKGDDSNFRKMVLHYQELNPFDSGNQYLDTNLQSDAFKLQDTAEPEKKYDVEFTPGNDNTMILTGIGVGYRGKKERIQYLKLYRNTILEVSED